MRRTLTAIAAAAVLGTAACQNDDPVTQRSSTASPPATTSSSARVTPTSSTSTSPPAPATPAAPATTLATSAAPSPPAAAGQLIEITVSGGKVQTEEKSVKVKQGTTVTLSVTSDVADKVHLHGYDLQRDVAPGAPMTLTFTADQPGGFEVELEGARLRLVTVRVS